MENIQEIAKVVYCTSNSGGLGELRLINVMDHQFIVFAPAGADESTHYFIETGYFERNGNKYKCQSNGYHFNVPAKLLNLIKSTNE